MFRPNMIDAELYIPNFTLFRKDRLHSEGGGSCIYAHNSLNVTLCDNFNVTDCVAVKIDCKPIELFVIVIYRSPSLTFDESVNILNQLTIFINSLPIDSEIVLTGDFNLPDVSWNKGVVNCPINSANKIYVVQKLYLQFFSRFNLQWVVTDNVKTRRRKVLNNIQEATLDQVLLSNKTMLKDFKTLSGLAASDHISLICNIGIQNDCRFLSMEKEKWSKFNMGQIRDHGNQINWTYSKSVELLSTEEMWNELHYKLCEISKHVPKYILKVAKDGSILEKPPWHRSFLEKARKIKDQFWRNFEETPTAKNYCRAVHKQNEFDEKLRISLMNYEHKITSRVNTNPKQFYRYLNSKRKIRDNLSGIKGTNGRPLESPKDVADELGRFFVSTFVTEVDGEIPTLSTRNNNIIGDLVISASDVKELLNELNIYKSLGPDGVHPKLLKSLRDNHNFVMALTELFQRCYDTGEIPTVWKEANITPLHKKGDRTASGNYRPISLTCIV